MENKKQKCSLKEYNKFDDNSYCQKFNIYMCNKCEKHHIRIFPNHQSFTLDNDITNIFTGVCKVENHQIELEYFGKTHNELCYAKCIAKVKKKELDSILIIMFSILKIYYMEKNKILKIPVDKLKILVVKLSKNKEEIKLIIQKVFTKVRNSINNREDELLLEVDNKYEKLYFNEDILKEAEKLPNKIKISLEKGKLIEKEWENNYKFLK